MIQHGSIVKFDYTLKVQGQVVDSSQGREPLQYTHGQGMIIPGLERALEGLKAGEEKQVIVGPEDAYGPLNPQAVIEVPKAQLGEGNEPAKGMGLKMKTKDGQVLNGIIADVKENTVVIDFNHPLAGKELTFEVKIVEVQ